MLTTVLNDQTWKKTWKNCTACLFSKEINEERHVTLNINHNLVTCQVSKTSILKKFIYNNYYI